MGRTPWVNTTHDWAAGVDLAHLTAIRADPWTFAPTGCLHLVLEVLAYAADEATSGAGHVVVTAFADGSVAVADAGRGTDTRRDAHGRVVRKPVLSSKDLRFCDTPEVERLPDGHPRRGMSVVAALSTWSVHVNRRVDGAWRQRYEHGVPVTDLLPEAGDGTTGTTVHFLADEDLRRGPVDRCEVARYASAWPQLDLAFATGADRPTGHGIA